MAGTANEGWRQPHRWVVVTAIVILTIIGLSTFRFATEAAARAKADRLIDELGAAGLRAPENPDTVARVLGNDGGAVCDDPGSALRKALLDAQLVNGAAFVGQRPVIAEEDVVRAEVIVLEVYCPRVLDDYREIVEDYQLDDVAGE